ncbi:hypothetical protein Salat_2130000 [Sesamum alatum]|uniref:Uncharacterized protein n=1 Tax=Sesamum alatum TaxID=300844 RepID=A0AAE1Y191_9LAMI|nr:hypothetical protein Salat_2130000 [Sesamum alatum]
MGPLFATLQQFFQYAQGQAPQASIPAIDQALERFLRFQPPKSFGEPDDYKAESWLDETENIFKVLRYDDEQKISFSTFRFEEAAHNCGEWWKHDGIGRGLPTRGPISSKILMIILFLK